MLFYIIILCRSLRYEILLKSFIIKLKIIID